MEWEVPHLLTGLAETPEVYFDSIAQVHLDSYARGPGLPDRRCGLVRLTTVGYGHHPRDGRCIPPGA